MNTFIPKGHIKLVRSVSKKMLQRICISNTCCYFGLFKRILLRIPHKNIKQHNLDNNKGWFLSIMWYHSNKFNFIIFLYFTKYIKIKNIIIIILILLLTTTTNNNINKIAIYLFIYLYSSKESS